MTALKSKAALNRAIERYNRSKNSNKGCSDIQDLRKDLLNIVDIYNARIEALEIEVNDLWMQLQDMESAE